MGNIVKGEAPRAEDAKFERGRRLSLVQIRIYPEDDDYFSRHPELEMSLFIRELLHKELDARRNGRPGGGN